MPKPRSSSRPAKPAGKTSGKGTAYGKRIVSALRQMSHYLDTHSRQLLKYADITIPQVICLDALMEKGAMTVAVLASHVHVSASTMVGIIDRLEKKKLVARTRDHVDRRSVFVDITDEGRKFIIATPHLLHNRLHKVMQHMSESEQVLIANSLERIVALLHEEDA